MTTPATGKPAPIPLRTLLRRLIWLALPTGWSIRLLDSTGAVLAQRVPPGFDTVAVALAAIPGLDAERGLRIASGNPDFYQQLLRGLNWNATSNSFFIPRRWQRSGKHVRNSRNERHPDHITTDQRLPDEVVELGTVNECQRGPGRG